MHVFITGAAQGIGKALTETFLNHSNEVNIRLTLVDIDEERLKTIAPNATNIQRITQDLTKLETLPALVKRAIHSFGPIDLLINNAGIMRVQSTASFKWRATLELFELNLLAPLKLIGEILPSMQERQVGSIINISSMAGVVPLRGCTFYGAAKAGLAMASECLQMELLADKIHVLTVYPGPIQTQLEENAQRGFAGNKVYSLLPRSEAPLIAQAIYEAWKKKKTRLIYPPAYQLGFTLTGAARKLSKLFTPKPTP